jgi:bifunctional non-homologous end joining protein LigD
MSGLELEGRELRLKNLDKVLWPAASFTKGDLIAFYRDVASALLPHLAERPVTLRRFPDGVDGLGWYQTQCRGCPAWMRTKPLRGRGGALLRYCLVDDVPSLVWTASVGTIELHPFLALGDRPQEPTVLVFDLDPGPPADILDCCRVAIRLRDLLHELHLRSFAKTSGSVGLHVYVPLNTPHSYGQTKAFARAVAARLARERPEEVVDRMQRTLRAGKVLIDWLQNDASRSTVAPYSLRATAWPTVSTPVAWGEVEGALAARRAELLTFDAREVRERLDRLGDLFRPVLELSQTLPADGLSGAGRSQGR